MCTSCLPDPDEYPVPGCVDSLGAQCIIYTADQTVAQALDSLQAGPQWQALLAYLVANPAVKNQLRTLLV